MKRYEFDAELAADGTLSLLFIGDYYKIMVLQERDVSIIKRCLRDARGLAIDTIMQYASETYGIWDAGKHDHKVGKRLKAMAGQSPRYDADLTFALEQRNEL